MNEHAGAARLAPQALGGGSVIAVATVGGVDEAGQRVELGGLATGTPVGLDGAHRRAQERQAPGAVEGGLRVGSVGDLGEGGSVFVERFDDELAAALVGVATKVGLAEMIDERREQEISQPAPALIRAAEAVAMREQFAEETLHGIARIGVIHAATAGEVVERQPVEPAEFVQRMGGFGAVAAGAHHQRPARGLEGRRGGRRNLSGAGGGIHQELHKSSKKTLQVNAAFARCREVGRKFVTFPRRSDNSPAITAMTMKTKLLSLVSLLVLALLGLSGLAQAQFVNGSFESPRQTPGVPDYDLLLDSAVPGWQTTASDDLIEIWSDGFSNEGGEPVVEAYEGFQHAELNATEFSTLFQDVAGIAANAKIGFEFAHRGRLGADTMRLTITDLGPDNLPNTGNETVLFTKTYTDGTNAWGFHTSSGEPAITALGNTMRFAYEAVSAAGGDPAIGNFIDACNFGVGVNVPCEFDFADRLIGYWPFDETNGLAAADLSGHGNSGALNNFSGNAQWVPGRVGGALNFDGVSQYVRVADYPKQISRTMSVAAWVWADAHTPWGTIIKNWGGTIPDQFHLGQTASSGEISMFIQERDGGQVAVQEGVALPLGRWEHVVFVADGANLTLCRNGVVVAGPIPYDGTITNPPVMGALGIGGKLDNAGNMPPIPIENPGFWDGKLDEVAVWSRPLSACECKALYQAGLAGKNILDPTITDTTPPTLVCSNLTIGTAFGCEGFPIYNVTATDDCNAVTIICVPPEGFAFPVGTTNVTCTAFDECGNSNSCSFTLTVRDTTPPQITTCPAARNIPGNPATCAGVTPNLVGEVVAMDNCSGSGALVITQSPAAGTPAVGLTPVVTIYASDPAGNTNTCTVQLTLNFPPPVCTMNFATGLIGYWPFDEASGLTAADASGNGNNGALNNFSGNAQWVPGRVGGALNFGGPISQQYVRVPDYPKTISSTMSVAAWVWADAHTPWGTIIKNWGGTTPGQFHLGQTASSGEISMFLQESDAGQVVIQEGTALPTGRWEHIVFTADGNNMWLCRNGVVVAGPVPYDGTVVNPPAMGSLGIGGKLDNAGNVPPIQIENPGFWQGKLDEVALWNRTLSACECRALYEAGLAGKNLLDPTIRDTTPPVLVCTNMVVPEEGPLFCYANVTYQLLALDACGKPTVVCVPPSGAFFNVGTAPVNCIATDACGNTADCTFTVTVVSTNDVMPPNINGCPTDFTLSADPFTCTTVVPDFLLFINIFDVGCTLPDRLIKTQTPPAGTVVSNGVHSVTITATDLNGNSSTCRFDLVVSFESTCQMDLSWGLLGYWPFDETNGLTANDATFWGNHGSLSNYTGDAQWVPGRVGGALNFGGPISQQYVRVPDYPKFISSTMTVAAWVWADAHTPWGTIIKNWGGTVPGQFHLGQTASSGQISMFLQESDAGQVLIQEGTALPTGRWEHIVFTADGQNMWLCRNGVVVAGPVPYDGTVINPPAMDSLGIGGKLDNAGNVPPIQIENPGFWQGKLDEVAIWSRPLTACECRALYEAGLAGKNLFDPSIRDVTPPAVACPANIVTNAAPDTCARDVTFDLAASDACSKAIVTCAPPSGHAFPAGVTTVNCAARDVCGNTNFCSFTVTVTDGMPPLLVCPAPRTNAPACAPVPVPDFLAGLTVTDNCTPGESLILSQTPAAGTLAGGGAHPITLTARDAAGNLAECVTAFHVPGGDCVALHSRAILWLPLDEPTGTVAHNLIAGGSHGAHANDPTPNPAALVHGSLGFDGTNDYVRVPNYSGLGRNAGQFTVEAWVKRAAGDNGRRVIVSRQGQHSTNAGLHGFEFLLDNGQMAARVITPSVTQDLSSAVTMPADGQWHHALMLFGMGGSAQFYLDGALSATVPHGRTFRMDVAGDVFVGSGGPAAHSFFKGWLDEVVMHSNLQTPAQIQALAAARANGRCKIMCSLPWDRHFTSNLVSLALPPAKIMSSHATPITVSWSIAPQSAMPILTPTSGSVTIPPFGTAMIPVTVGPPPFTQRYHFWMLTMAPPGGCPSVCTGLVVYTGSIAATPPMNTSIAGTNGVITTSVPLTGLAPGQQGRVVAVNMNTMMPDTTTVSLNGLPPGTPVEFSAPLASPLPGGGGGGMVSMNLGLDIRFLEPDPVTVFVIVVEVDLDGLGQFDPIASFDVQNTFVPPPTLRIVTVGNQRQVQWNNEGDGLGILESAPDVTGPWNPVMGAAPGYVLPATPAQQFYRVVVP